MCFLVVIVEVLEINLFSHISFYLTCYSARQNVYMVNSVVRYVKFEETRAFNLNET